ncbi:hypothetical protein BJX61DRAFT_549944 [Aspergillus egyptiacus]|nr:hypothetical protein BJX61DRAFT_549944 [Aspergillus egyptiacus]
MLPSSSSNSSQSSIDSPISPYQHAWFPNFPSIRRRRVQLPKYPRFYSTPLNNEIPDSTPLQMYGLEEREPSIIERPRRFRFSRALDDIKEDSTQPDHHQPPTSAVGIRSRRHSTFSFFETNFSNPTLNNTLPTASVSGFSLGSCASTRESIVSDTRPPMSAVPSEPTPGSASSSRMKLGRRLSRRLSVLSFAQRKGKYRAGNASISQPNLIGSSNQI